MEKRTFEEISAAMDLPHVQHYIPSLQGCLVAGDTVLLDHEVQLTNGLASRHATIIRAQESGSFLLNFFVLPSGRNGVTVPRIPVPRKRTFIGYPSEEVLQTTYVSVISGERIVGIAFLLGEHDILSGRKAFRVGMVDCFFIRLRLNDDFSVGPFGGPFGERVQAPNCRSLAERTWGVRKKLQRVIMEALNSSSLTSTFRRHKTVDFAEWEWAYFAEQFDNPPVAKKGFVTLRVNRLDGAKESCKIRTNKKVLQFTTSDEIAKLKTILGSSITVSVNSGFPAAPKRIRAADEYIFSSQTASESEFVNAVLPEDILESHRPNGFIFLWSQETEKLRVTTQWGKFRISNQWVRNQIRGSEILRADSGPSQEADGIEIGEDFAHHQAQFEVQGMVGDSHVRCTVIESDNIDFVLGQYFNFRVEFVQERIRDNY
jgi:hypothetical protein